MEADPECEAWLAWAAGLIDGEGTLFLSNLGKGAYVRVAMTDDQAPRKLHALLGGSLQAYPPRAGRKPTYVWFRSGRLALSKTLRLIRPWLVTKAREADVLLDYLTEPTHQGRKTTRSERAHREQVYWKLRELKMSHSKNWISGAIKRPGALTKKAKKAGESPMEYAEEHKHAKGRTGKQARLALTLGKLRKK